MEWSTPTAGAGEFTDVTARVEDAVARSGIMAGQVTVFSPTPGASIVVNERESGLLEDIKQTMERVSRSGDGKGKAFVGSSSVVLPAEDGMLRLGTWQRVLLVELEGASERHVVVQVVGE